MVNVYREQKAKEALERWKVLDAVAAYFAEVKGRRSYLSGEYGKLSDSEVFNLDSRVNNTLISATKFGVNQDLYLEYAIDDGKIIDKLSKELLTYYVVSAEAAWQMWSGQHHIQKNNRGLKELAITYKCSRRMLLRYKKIDRATLKSWLPPDFVL